VDDQRTNLAVLERLARGLSPDLEVRSFTRGMDALTAFESDPPDLVVTDFIMPGMNGAMFIRTLRTMPQCADIPVIVITAYEDKTLRYEALDAGATDYLISPIDALEFRARSVNLLTLRAQQKMLKHHAASLERRLVDDAERHRSELRQSHDRLLRVIDAVPVAISATNAQGRFEFVNRPFLELFGLAAESVIGASVDGVLPPMVAGLWRGAGTGSHRAEVELPARPGRDPLHLRLEQIALPGSSPQGDLAVTVLVDVSQHKHAELAMQDAKEMAEAANRTKTEFLANMSHELRTPLNAIIGFSELMMRELAQGDGPAEHVDYMQDILNSGRMLLGVVNNILDLSKIEAGAVALEEQDVDVPRLIQGVLQMLRGWAPVGSADVQFEASPDLPRLRADPQRLRQILLNLLSNAAKFSAAPGTRIEVRAQLQDGCILIQVHDHGIGMSREEIAVAVTRFGQVASPWTRAHPGTGLGLPIAIRLSELHAATLSIDSEKGRGTVVSVLFPAGRTIPVPELPNPQPRGSADDC
jgi:signal transduction histidine kinase